MEKTIIEPSASFKAKLNKTKKSILLFIGVYVLLLLFAMSLSIAGIYAGLYILMALPGVITIFAGAGIAGMGLLVFFFLIKFIFKTHKTSPEGLIEIERKNHPGLFKLLDELTEKTDTSFPHKVYLSPEINAGVFYQSSFWSMFFPVKKNLLIGMGLFNTLSQQELNAVLAHEFGHFSQKSMKAGSYVYNVNRVIYNMLYDNEKFEALAVNWTRQLGFFGIFIVIAIYIIMGIQWILKRVYNTVNKNHLALSREMEFHADEIAAHITGHEALKNALLRMQLAEHSFETAINFHLENNYKSSNIYPAQSFVMNYLAQIDQMKIINAFPLVELQDLNKYNKSKLVIENQWASHPGLEARIKQLEKTGTSSQTDAFLPANELLNDYKKLQEKFTRQIFAETKNTVEIDFDTFKTKFIEDFNAKRFPEIYNGYYDNKNPEFFDTTTSLETENIPPLEELFSDNMVEKIYLSISLENDIEILKKIQSKEIKIKSFDYDGKRYKAKNSRRLIQQLKSGLKKLKEEIRQNDKHIFVRFNKLADQAGENQLGNKYDAFFDFEKQVKIQTELYNTLIKSLQFIYTQVSIVEIKNHFVEVEYQEQKLKRSLREILEKPEYKKALTDKNRKLFELYLSKEWKYFGNRVYFEKNLEMLFNVLDAFLKTLSQTYFNLKLDLLNYQAGLVPA